MEVDQLLRISESGSVIGEIVTERLIINGHFEGICRASYIEILSSGHISGTIYSDNLSIESGGKFMGVTKSPSELPQTQSILEHGTTELENKDINHEPKIEKLEPSVEKLKS